MATATLGGRALTEQEAQRVLTGADQSLQQMNQMVSQGMTNQQILAALPVPASEVQKYENYLNSYRASGTSAYTAQRQKNVAALYGGGRSGCLSCGGTGNGGGTGYGGGAGYGGLPAMPSAGTPPALPSIGTPTMPSVETPTMPSVGTPTMPSVGTPTLPSVGTPPALPPVGTPAMPSVETPTMPSVGTPTVTPAPEYKPSPEEAAWMESYKGQLENWVTSGGYGIPAEVQGQMIQRQTDTLMAKETEDIRVMHNNMERRGLTNSGFIFSNEMKIKSATTQAIANSMTDIQVQSSLMKLASFEKSIGAMGEFLGYLSAQSQLAYAPKSATWSAQQQANLAAYQAQQEANRLQYQAQQQTKLTQYQAQHQANLAAYQAQQQAKLTQYQAQHQVNLTQYQAQVQTKLTAYQAQQEANLTQYQAQHQANLAQYQALLQTKLTAYQAQQEANRTQYAAQVQTNLTQYQAQHQTNLTQYQAQQQAKLTAYQAQVQAVLTQYQVQAEMTKAQMVIAAEERNQAANRANDEKLLQMQLDFDKWKTTTEIDSAAAAAKSNGINSILGTISGIGLALLL